MLCGVWERRNKIWNQGENVATAEIANSKDIFFLFIIILLRIRLGLFYE